MPARDYSPAEKAAFVAKLAAGRAAAKARRPQRLREVEELMREVGGEIDALREAGQPIPWALRTRLRDLAYDRLRLKWGAS